MQLLKKRGASYALAKHDRGLLVRGSFKDQKSSRIPGPGAYDTADAGSMADAMRKHNSRRNPVALKTNMSRASRDFAFSKFASGNAGIYTRGLY